MKKRRKIIVFGVTILMVMSTACKTVPISEDQMEPITFTFYNCDGGEDPWTDPVARMITQETGVTLETQYPSDGQDNGILLMMATGELPDLVFAKGDSHLLIEHGDLLDISGLIEEYGPNIKKLYGEDFDLLRYSKEDPAIYQLCCGQVQEEVLSSSGTAQLQWDVLSKNHYRIPTTLDEYATMIRDYKAKYPTINGKETIGISISCTDWYWYTTLSNPSGFIANGAVDNGQWIVTEDNTVLYKHTAQGQKEYYQWLNQMYHEGILDPDFATQTHEDYLEKIAQGRVLGLLDAQWDYASAESVLKANDQYERTYAGLPVTLNKNIICAALRQQGLSVGWGIGITKKCKDPVRAVQFLDWMCSEEAQVLLNWGIENVNYFYDENGVRYRTAEEIEMSEKNMNYGELTGVGLHSYPFPSYGNMAVDSTGNYINIDSRKQIISEYNKVQKAALEAWNVEMLIDIFPSKETFAPIEYTPLWTKVLPQEINETLAVLDAIAWKGLIDSIVCPPEMFDSCWNKLQKDFIDAGVEDAQRKMTEIVQKEVAFHQGG